MAKQTSLGDGGSGAKRTTGDGSGTQRMGGGDYNFISSAYSTPTKTKQTAAGVVAAGVAAQGAGTSKAKVATGPTAAQKAAAAEAARKNAIRSQYGEAQAQNSTVYDAATNQINQQKTGITSGFGRGIKLIARDANNRVRMDKAVNKARANNQAQAAQRMGLDFMPTTRGTADAAQAANRSALLRNALTWRGLLTAQEQTALQRNQAQASTFQAGKVSQSAAIEQLMLKALGLA